MKTLVLAVAVILISGCGTGEELPAVNSIPDEDSPAEVADSTEQIDTSAVVTEVQPEDVPIETDSVTEAIIYTLKQGIAGVFAVGSSEDDTFEASLVYSNGTIEEIELMAEGMAYPALKMNFEDSGSILLELSDTDRTVCRIEINSPLFKTEEGVGIGSTYSDLLSNYSFDGISWGDNGDPLVIVEEAGMSFLLEPGDWWQMGEVQGEIPGDTEVTSIVLW
ncbi:MAG: hypothetical protein B1H09_01650 [Gemmatimonadaceae bacterium 4484_173]|nr:MAG: hypothetical protein B1H09_01650 [Gemmatimonadaceae bacterium 4484_173]